MKQIVLILLLLPSVAFGALKTPSFKSFLIEHWYDPNYDHLDGQWGGSSILYDNQPPQWFADRYDFFEDIYFVDIDTMVALNPNLEMGYYTNLYELGNRPVVNTDRMYKIVANYCADNSVPIESMFFHFADDTIRQVFGGVSRWISIDSLKNAGNDSATRISMRGWYASDPTQYYYPACNGNWLCNFTSPTYRAARAWAEGYYFDNFLTYYSYAHHVPQYLAIDNYSPVYQTMQFGYWLNPAVTGSAGGPTGPPEISTNRNYVDLDAISAVQTHESDNFSDFGVYKAPFLGQVSDSLQNHGCVGVIPNVTIVHSDEIGKLADFAKVGKVAGIWFENRGSNWWCQAWNPNDYLRWHDTVYVESPTCKQFWEFRHAITISTGYDTTRVTSDRRFLASFALFLWFQNYGVDYFKFGRSNSYYWWKAHEIDIGTPTEARAESSMTSISSPPLTARKLCTRKYQNGLVLYRPPMISTEDTTYTNAVVVNLGQQYYQIGARHDSTVVGPTIQIRAIEGILLQSIRGTAITHNITSVSFPESLQVRDSCVVFRGDSPADSFHIGYNDSNSVTGWTYIGSVLDSVGQVSLTGLGVDSTYYFWGIGFEGDSSVVDTSNVRAIATSKGHTLTISTYGAHSVEVEDAITISDADSIQFFYKRTADPTYIYKQSSDVIYPNPEGYTFSGLLAETAYTFKATLFYGDRSDDETVAQTTSTDPPGLRSTVISGGVLNGGVIQ